MYCKLRVLLLSSCCRRLWTDLKNDSWVDGWAGWAVVLLGAARVELLVVVLLLGTDEVVASSRGRLTGSATTVLLVFEEDGRSAFVEEFAPLTLLLEPGTVLLVLLWTPDGGILGFESSGLAAVVTELLGLTTVADACGLDKVETLLAPIDVVAVAVSKTCGCSSILHDGYSSAGRSGDRSKSEYAEHWPRSSSTLSVESTFSETVRACGS
jgi:hypothetical protein